MFGRRIGATIASTGIAFAAILLAAGEAHADVTVTVKCQQVENSGGASVGYLYGTGSGPSIGDAIRDAKKNVVVPEGYYKRHCKKI